MSNQYRVIYCVGEKMNKKNSGNTRTKQWGLDLGARRVRIGRGHHHQHHHLAAHHQMDRVNDSKLMIFCH